MTSFIGVDGLLAQMAHDRCVRGTETKSLRYITLQSRAVCTRVIDTNENDDDIDNRCFPQILLRKNKWRKTHHVIILSFLVLSLGARGRHDYDVFFAIAYDFHSPIFNTHDYHITFTIDHTHKTALVVIMRGQVSALAGVYSLYVFWSLCV